MKSLKPISTHSIAVGEGSSVINNTKESFYRKNELSKVESKKSINNDNLNDYQFRRTLTKKTEKISINCDSNKNNFVELKHFLENINQIKYFDAFKENCFDELSSILEIKENHLNVLGINEEDQECFFKKK